MVNISEIPALTLEQKQKFWKLGQELWQITALELYENIARNVALVIRRQLESNLPIGVVELHWSAENPFRLLLAILRHLVNCHLTSRVRWYGQPPPQWNSIAPLVPNFVDDPFDAHENAFHLYFINEVEIESHVSGFRRNSDDLKQYYLSYRDKDDFRSIYGNEKSSKC